MARTTVLIRGLKEGRGGKGEGGGEGSFLAAGWAGRARRYTGRRCGATTEKNTIRPCVVAVVVVIVVANNRMATYGNGLSSREDNLCSGR